MKFTAGSLIAGLLFSSIGMVAFTYGKRTGGARAMFLGAALIGYPFVVSDTLWLCVVGGVLTGALFVYRD